MLPQTYLLRIKEGVVQECMPRKLTLLLLLPLSERERFDERESCKEGRGKRPEEASN